MKIKLNPADVIIALQKHIESTGVSLTDKTVTYKFNNRRTKGGIFAEIDILDAAFPSATTDEPSIVQPVEVEQPATVPTVEPQPQEVTAPAPVSLFG
jgi:hypothetical protein